MAFIVETGSGTPGANALASVAFVDAYLAERNRSDEAEWSDASVEEKQADIVEGTDYIETRWGPWFKGSKALQVISGRVASGLLELTGAPANGELLTVGQKIYRLVTALAQENDVLIGADEIETAANLVSAINLSGSIGTTVHEDTLLNYEAFSEADEENVIVVARTKGESGNLIVFETTIVNSTISGSGFLAGGVDESEQPLSFPRVGLYTRSGRAIIGVPLKAKQATAEYAVRSRAARLNASKLAPDPAIDPRLMPVVRFREKTGPLEEEVQYAEGARPNLITPYPAADRLLAEFVRVPGGTFRA